MAPFHLVAVHTRPELTPLALALLEAEWPRSGHAAKLCRSRDEWPLHLVAVTPPADAVVAHACLQRTVGDAAVLHSFVVAPASRGCGLGTRVLAALEGVCRSAGCAYLLLSTDSAVGFYRRCGYTVHAGTVTHARVLEGVPLTRLEAVLKRKAADAAGGGADGASGEGAGAGTTWMRKRLLGFHPPGEVDAGAAAHARALLLLDGAVSLPPVLGEAANNVAWRRQAGPSCGLTAVLCIAETLVARVDAGRVTLPPPVVHALRWTVRAPEARLLTPLFNTGASADGEVFDTHALAAVLRSACGLHVRVVEHAGERGGKGGLVALATQLRAVLHSGGWVLIAYDEDGSRGHTPCHAGGAKAHWLVITSCVLEGDGGDALLLLQHTLSPAPVVCRLSAALASNAQLDSLHACSTRASEEGWVTRPVRSAQQWEASGVEEEDEEAERKVGGEECGALGINGLAGKLLFVTLPLDDGPA